MSEDKGQKTDRGGSTERQTGSGIMVRRSDQSLEPWDRKRLIRNLREAGIPARRAQALGRRVEVLVARTGVMTVPAELVREVVAAELLAAGLAPERVHSAVLGMPLRDLDRIVRLPSEVGSTAGGDPELSGWLIARRLKTEYALNAVFSEPVAEAHLKGDIHLHGLGDVDRPASIWLRLESLQRAGLNLTRGGAVAGPARHPEVLVAHLARYTEALRAHFSGPVGWDALNVSFAPYITGWTEEQMRRLAERMLYELSEMCSDRRHTEECCRLGLHGEVPAGLAEMEALGPGGRPTGRNYRAYEQEARAFARVLLEVYASGDERDAPFRRIRPTLVVDQGLFRRSGHRELLGRAGEAARRRGRVSFLFPRGGRVGAYEEFTSQTGAGGGPARSGQGAVVLQVVSVNLPRLGLIAEGDAQEALSYVEPVMELAAEAHQEKRVFIEGLMALGRQGPLGLLAGGSTAPLLALDESLHAIAPCGLNELAQLVTGEGLSEGGAARSFAEDLLTRMAKVAGALSRRRKLQFRVGLVADKPAALRFTGLDLRHHAAAMEALGDRMGHVRYTPGVGLPEGLPVAPERRLLLEGEVGRPLQRPCPTRLAQQQLESDPERLAEFFMHIYVHTRCRELRVEPHEQPEP